MTFVAGQRSEMGRYEAPWEVSFPGFGIGMINDGHNLTSRDREVGEGGDILNRSRSEIFQDFSRNVEFVWAKCLTISTALDCSHY